MKKKITNDESVNVIVTVILTLRILSRELHYLFPVQATWHVLCDITILINTDNDRQRYYLKSYVDRLCSNLLETTRMRSHRNKAGCLFSFVNVSLFPSFLPSFFRTECTLIKERSSLQRNRERGTDDGTRDDDSLQTESDAVKFLNKISQLFNEGVRVDSTIIITILIIFLS